MMKSFSVPAPELVIADEAVRLDGYLRCLLWTRCQVVDLFAVLPPADAARIVKLACVRNTNVVSVLPGGITKRNYKVTTPAGIVVVRLSDAGSSALAIDRDNEHLNSISAAVCGAGAPVIEYLPEAHHQHS